MSFRETISELFADTPAAWDLGEVMLEDGDIKQKGIEQVLLSRIHEKIECVCRFMREVYELDVMSGLGRTSEKVMTIEEFITSRLQLCWDVAGSLGFSLAWYFRQDGSDVGFLEVVGVVNEQHGPGQTFMSEGTWANGATPGKTSISEAYRIPFFC